MPEPDDRSDAYHAAREGALRWLTGNWDPELTVRAWWARLADSGWAFPTWPEAWFGQALSADAGAGVRSAFPESGALPPPTGLGQLLGGPMLLLHASDEQKARFLPALVRGEESWCQFFSEPGSGSDLASAQTRAVRGDDADDGGWTVDGQKVWTSGAQWADRGMLLARTNRDVPKHQGLSFFIIDVGQPAIEVRPLHQMNGEHHFNEVFFTGAHIDEDRMISEPGNGWSVAVTVLMYERFMASLPSAMPGTRAGQLDQQAGAAAARAAAARTSGRTGVSELVIDVAGRLGETTDLVRRQELAALWAQETTNGYLARGGQSARDGKRPSARGSLTKLARSQLVREGRDTGMSVLGAQGMLAGPDTTGGGEVQHRALSSPGASIAGGTDEIQRGIVGERLLGLPKEPRTDRDVPFKDLTIGTQRTEKN
ncbi:MAG TPA: acyl-CoA dehydrogenase family protein [Streptosporangiaceae bacterium]